MGKKIITYLLLFSFLNYVGCSSTQYITVNEYDTKRLEKHPPSEIYVTTNDSKKYHFINDEYYYIRNDTLYSGIKIDAYRIEYGEKIKTGGVKTIQKKLPLSDIKSIEESTPNEITVTTIAGEELQFENKGYYYVKKDSLCGKGKLLLENGDKNFEGEIAFSNIKSIHSGLMIDGELAEEEINIVEKDENEGAEIIVLLKNGSEIYGELLLVSQSDIILSTQLSAAEEDLVNFKFPITTIQQEQIEELTFEGSSYILAGLGLGTLTGIGAGLIVAASSNPTGDFAGLAYVFGFALGFLVGSIAGSIIGNAVSTDDIVFQNIPQGYDFSAFKPLSRYPGEVPDFMK